MHAIPTSIPNTYIYTDQIRDLFAIYNILKVCFHNTKQTNIMMRFWIIFQSIGTDQVISKI